MKVNLIKSRNKKTISRLEEFPGHSTFRLHVTVTIRLVFNGKLCRNCDYVTGDVGIYSVTHSLRVERKPRVAWESCHRTGWLIPLCTMYFPLPSLWSIHPRDYYAKCLTVLSGRVFRASAIYLRVLYSWDCVVARSWRGVRLTVHYAVLQGYCLSFDSRL